MTFFLDRNPTLIFIPHHRLPLFLLGAVLMMKVAEEVLRPGAGGGRRGLPWPPPLSRPAGGGRHRLRRGRAEAEPRRAPRRVRDPQARARALHARGHAHSRVTAQTPRPAASWVWIPAGSHLDGAGGGEDAPDAELRPDSGISGALWYIREHGGGSAASVLLAAERNPSRRLPSLLRAEIQKVIQALADQMGATPLACTIESIFKVKCKNCRLRQYLLLWFSRENIRCTKEKKFYIMEVIRKFMRDPYQILVKKEDLALERIMVYNNFERGWGHGPEGKRFIRRQLRLGTS
ncbi:uncharacterized protein [Dasypus novemcinctus]|uniref:uncharacterized protein isoform X2 n=1 Tax=Dasypus novemcinctus TaxID=9361 RepID=UPI0003290464|nr:uncharacterized protein LOC101443698 isoform X2 [Dasypus novemcinctus]